MIPLRIIGHTLLRHEKRVFAHTLRKVSGHEHSRQKKIGRVRNDRAQEDRTGSLIHRNLGKLKVSRVAVFAAILQREGDLRLVVADSLDLAAGNFPFEAQKQGS